MHEKLWFLGKNLVLGGITAVFFDLLSGVVWFGLMLLGVENANLPPEWLFNGWSISVWAILAGLTLIVTAEVSERI